MKTRIHNFKKYCENENRPQNWCFGRIKKYPRVIGCIITGNCIWVSEKVMNWLWRRLRMVISEVWNPTTVVVDHSTQRTHFNFKWEGEREGEGKGRERERERILLTLFFFSLFYEMEWQLCPLIFFEEVMWVAHVQLSIHFPDCR